MASRVKTQRIAQEDDGDDGLPRSGRINMGEKMRKKKKKRDRERERGWELSQRMGEAREEKSSSM